MELNNYFFYLVSLFINIFTFCYLLYTGYKMFVDLSWSSCWMHNGKALLRLFMQDIEHHNNIAFQIIKLELHPAWKSYKCRKSNVFQWFSIVPQPKISHGLLHNLWAICEYKTIKFINHYIHIINVQLYNRTANTLIRRKQVNLWIFLLLALWFCAMKM